MLSGTKVTLSVFAPTREDAISRPKTRTISANKIEFPDTAAYDTTKDKLVVPASVDVHGSVITSVILAKASGSFTNVTGKHAFNGFGLTFAELTADPRSEIVDLRLGDGTTSGLSVKRLSFDDDTVFVNLDNLDYDPRDKIVLRVGLGREGTSKADKLVGGEGRDHLEGHGGADELRGGTSKDLLEGGDGADKLYGGAGADTLRGGSGADMLRGGDGDDRLLGGAGADRLLGGAGADTFIFHHRADSAPGAATRDTILDFTRGKDRIDLSHIDADRSKAGDQAFHLIGDAAFSHHKGELRVFHQHGDTLVTADVTGDGKAELSILVHGILDLTHADFIL